MGMEGSVCVVYVLFQGADIQYIHIVHIVIYKRVDHLTCMRDLLVFSDTINCKSRKQKLVSCEIAAAPPCFVVLQASMFHPLMMGFLVKFVRTVDSILVVICVWQLHQLTVIES